MKKIFILGTVGVDKTRLADQLSDKFGLDVYDLDDVFWEKKFSKKRDEEDRKDIFDELINKKSWIIEGVYNSWIEKGIMESDMVIFLRMPLSALSGRVTKNNIKRKGKSFRGYESMLRNARNYYKTKHKTGYFKHEEIVGDRKIGFIMLRKGKEMKEFIENFN